MRIFDGKQYRDATAEEIAELQREANRAAMEERTRPLTTEEVSRMLIAAQINTLKVDDNTALRMTAFYPAWAAETAYDAGYKVQFGGRLWRVLQAHTAQPGWTPDVAASLWEQVCETHSGAADDPIPYSGNMALTEGLHYVDWDVIYRCIRSTGTPVFQPLAELVDLFVEVVA